jgi:hypothetical protein
MFILAASVIVANASDYSGSPLNVPDHGVAIPGRFVLKTLIFRRQ